MIIAAFASKVTAFSVFLCVDNVICHIYQGVRVWSHLFQKLLYFDSRLSQGFQKNPWICLEIRCSGKADFKKQNKKTDYNAVVFFFNEISYFL